LTFGAVDYWCQVYVNRQLVAEHEGGYTPFTIPIQAYVQPGQNEITVRVYDSAQTDIVTQRWPTPDTGATPDKPPFDPRDIPHGKQEWYINVGGIWQDITLTAVPATFIEYVHVTPNIQTGQVEVAVKLAGNTTQFPGGSLRVSVAGANAESTIPLSAG